MNQYDWEPAVHAACEKIGRNVTGIYKFTNKLTGEFYIGQAKNIAERIKCHSRDSKNNPPNKSHWHKSLFAAGGVSAFDIEILEITPLCAATLKARENHWLAHYEAGKSLNCLNTHSQAGVSPIGSTLPEVSRLRLSLRHKGIPRPDWVKKKISATKLTPEGRARNSAANRGRKMTPERYAAFLALVRSPEHRAKLRAVKKGTRPSEKCFAAVRSEKTLRKIRQSCAKRRGIPLSQEIKDRIRQKMLGVKHTAERRRNQSLGRKRFLSENHNPWSGRKHRPESRAKMSASSKARRQREKLYVH